MHIVRLRADTCSPTCPHKLLQLLHLEFNMESSRQKTFFGAKSLLLATIMGSLFVGYKLFGGEDSYFVGRTNFSRSVGVQKVSVKF